MVYIISEKKDLVTDLVIEWLIDKKQKFKRYNTDDFVKVKTKLSNEADQVPSFAGARKVWQRRGGLEVLPKPVLSNYPNRFGYVDYLSREVNVLNLYQEFRLKNLLNENYIGSLGKELGNNKLINLLLAKEVGLQIPNTLITTSKKEFIDFYNRYNPLISKDLRAPVSIKTKHKTIASNGVEMITKESLESLAEVFAPVFLQQYIEKKYEIRAFVILGKIFPMAIFSQNDKQTKIDYRNYNKAKPNRCVPVKLPKEVEERIHVFMARANINTGSIDLICTPVNEYYFLEINPMGQFHWVSQNCNHQIEKEIAKFLCDEKE